MPRLLPLLFICLILPASAWSQGRQVEGIVIADQDITISAATENVIVELAVEEGDSVEKGQLLARLDSRTQELQVALWEKRLELLEVAYESTRNLSRDNIVSREETLTAEIERDLARIQLDIAKAELDDTELRSAIDGVVVTIEKEEGELVRRGEELFRIVNADVVFVQLYLPAEAAEALELDDAFDIQFPSIAGAPTRRGRISFIDPAVDPNSGFQRVRLMLPNPGNIIRPGQRCRVRFP